MSNIERTQEEIEKNIKFVLEDKVAPAVAQHNGKIEYISFKLNPIEPSNCAGYSAKGVFKRGTMLFNSFSSQGNPTWEAIRITGPFSDITNDCSKSKTSGNFFRKSFGDQTPDFKLRTIFFVLTG